jgi:hypothetical protein
MRSKPPPPPDRPRSPRHKSRGAVSANDNAIKQPTLRELTRQLIEKEDMDAFWREINHGSDRSSAIVAAATVDRDLEEAILSSLTISDEETRSNLIATGGALDGFFAKIHLGYALGIFPKLYMHELDSIRKIRNCFAHSSKPVTFETKQIAEECKRFRARDYISGDISNRSRYMSACRILFVYLKTYGLTAVAEKSLKRHKPGEPYYAEAAAGIQEMKDRLRLLIVADDAIAEKILQAPSSKDS